MKATQMTGSTYLKSDPAAERREAKRNQKISNIIDVSIDVFADEGVAGFSMRKVASASGISLSTIQHYFGTHENLLKSTIDHAFMGHVSNYLEVCNDQSISPKERLDMIIDDGLQSARNKRIVNFFTNLWSLSAHNEPMRDVVKHIYKQYYYAVTEIVTVLRPDLPREKCTALAHLIAAQVDGILVWFLMGPHEGLDEETAIERFREIWHTMIDSCFTAE